MTQGSSEDTVSVIACGSTLQFSRSDMRGFNALQQLLQSQMTIVKDETFEIFDVDCNQIMSDLDLFEALSKDQLPLQASLSEASIHLFENKREELMQMQWDLVRGQIANLGDQLDGISKRLVELTNTAMNQRKGEKNFSDSLHAEMTTLVDHSKDSAKQLLHPFAERLDSMSHQIQSERVARDMVKQGIEQQILHVRETLEGERKVRQKESQATASLVREFQQALAADVSSRVALEELHKDSVARVHDRIESVSRSQIEQIQDASDQIRVAAANSHTEMHDYTRHVHRTRVAAETLQIDVGLHRNTLEEKVVQLETCFEELKRKKLLPRPEPTACSGSTDVSTVRPQNACMGQTPFLVPGQAMQSMPPMQSVPPMQNGHHRPHIQGMSADMFQSMQLGMQSSAPTQMVASQRQAPMLGSMPQQPRPQQPRPPQHFS